MEELGIYLVITAMFLIIWSYKDKQPSTAVVGATLLEDIAKLGNAMKPRPAPAPKPKLVSRFPTKTTYRPIRGTQTQQGSHVQQLHKNLVRKYTLSQAWQKMTPIQKTRIINTWIERARRIMRARILAAIKAKRSGYSNVGYSGGFGGTIAPNTPPLTGAVGANELSAWEEALGLKPITNTSKLSASQARMQRTANDAITQYSKCENDKACKAAAAKKFDQIVFSNSTSMINNLNRLQGKSDPTQSQV